jgi:hypothetical protein
MDPQGMTFDGIGCLRMNGSDTVFYISCHINRDKIDRIVKHSKFELVLDTLVINPTRCNLPNSKLKQPFLFEERGNFQLGFDLNITSSWITQGALFCKDQPLGKFTINVLIQPSDLNEKGVLRYVRSAGAAPRYAIEGESFLIPRSYTGIFDEEVGRFDEQWGTGEFKIEVLLRERCSVTPAFRQGWKEDMKRRRRAEQNGKNMLQNVWKHLASQRWDDIGKQWVITTLKAPAAMLTSDVLEELDLPAPAATTTTTKGK